MKNIAYIFLIFSMVFMSCENEDWEFPDYDYQSVYFAHQYPVRTITLGEDIFDTSLDNEWKFQILATTGGVYTNESSIIIDLEVDNSLVEGMVFDGTNNEIVAMPNDYYSIISNQGDGGASEMSIPKGSLTGGIEVQLTDAFFNDPLAIRNTYVIPMRMLSVQNADSILSGLPVAENPRRGVADDWAIAPKDYVFYAVKYVNPWHGFYLRRGVDVITGDVDSTVVRHGEYVEYDEVNMLSTRSLNEVEFPLAYQRNDGSNIECTLILTFDDAGNCTVSSGTPDVTATGSGTFVKDGEEKSWGNQDRDALYLSYSIDLNEIQVSATDTLVMRNRGVTMELFNPILQ